MSNSLHHPHDSAFRMAMKEVRAAREMIEPLLPADIQSAIDWQTFQPETASYVDDQLSQTHSDCLYSAKINGKDTYIYCLLEHQSAPSKRMPLRLLDYTVRIMQDHVAKGNANLPLVLPMVLYTGDKSYTETNDLYELFESPQLARELMFRPFAMLDLTMKDDGEIMSQKWAGLLLMIMKHINDRDLKKLIDQLYHADMFKYAYSHDGDRFVQGVLYYLCKSGNEDQADILEYMAKTYDDLKGDAMTIAEKLQSDALKQGMQQGMDKKAYLIAENMLREHIGTDLVAKTTGLATSEVEKIKTTLH